MSFETVNICKTSVKLQLTIPFLVIKIIMSKLQNSIPSWPMLIVYTIYDHFLSMVLKPGTTAIMK